MTAKLIRAFHVLGVVLFFGSILGHAIGGLAPALHSSPETELLARQMITVATRYLTIPGLALLMITGIAMVLQRKGALLKARWFYLHAGLALIILINAFVILIPIGGSLLAIAEGLVSGTGTNDGRAVLQGREAMFGAANVVLSLVVLFLGVLKPRFGTKKVKEA